MTAPARSSALGLLVLEDDRLDARLLRETLRDAGDPDEIVMQNVRSLADALDAIAQFSFSCALVDLGLPDSQGTDIVARLREADPSLAIVVITGNEDPAGADRALRLGAEAYLVKGRQTPEQLIGVIRQAVERSRRRLLAGRRPEEALHVVQRYRHGNETQHRAVEVRGLLSGHWLPQLDALQRQETGFDHLLLHWEDIASDLLEEPVQSSERLAALASRGLQLGVLIPTLTRRDLAPQSVSTLETLRRNGIQLVLDEAGPDATTLDLLLLGAAEALRPAYRREEASMERGLRLLFGAAEGLSMDRYAPAGCPDFLSPLCEWRTVASFGEA
ncbi:MAG TPA: response regulator [Nevskiaceae bacterium]|nr:response regulator [Nevskiaceae bacterium]